MNEFGEIARKEYVPGYMKLGESDWRRRIRAAFDLLEPCRLCPRQCRKQRLQGETGVCKGRAAAEVSSCNLHGGEEPPLSGWKGSGAIFFTHCSLRCVFCQNYPLSQLGHGNETESEGLAEMILELQEAGAHNVDFITPNHVAPWIIEAVALAAERGLQVPLVWNSSGYDSLEELRLMDGIIDIYLPDMKYNDNAVAARLSNAPDYVEVNRAAIREMHRQVGDLVLDEDGIARRGLIIRHLVLPQGLAGTEGIMQFIAGQISQNTAVSLMRQYFPAHRAFEFPELSRRVSQSEYLLAVQAMEKAGLHQGWRQGI